MYRTYKRRKELGTKTAEWTLSLSYVTTGHGNLARTHTSKQREMRPRGEAGDEQFAATDGGEEEERRRGGEDAKEQLRSRCTDTGGRLRVAERPAVADGRD